MLFPLSMEKEMWQLSAASPRLTVSACASQCWDRTHGWSAESSPEICAHLCHSKLRITMQICSVELQGLGILMEISLSECWLLKFGWYSEFGVIWAINVYLQLLEDRVKSWAEGSVKDRRSAWLGHRLLPGKRSVHLVLPSAQRCLFHTLFLLPLETLGCWNKGWVLLCKEPLIIPVLDYLEQEGYSVRGGGKKIKRGSLWSVLLACLMINQNGFHSLEIHRAHFKKQRQREAEIAFVGDARGSLRAPSAKPLLAQVLEIKPYDPPTFSFLM